LIFNKRNFKSKREQLVLWLSIIICTMVVIQQDWLWRLNNVIYDAQLRLWERPAPDNIIIIGIDEYSLQHLGRWPWSRDKYAKLLDVLTTEEAAVVGLDIIFAEPSSTNTQDDIELAKAVKRNGRVVLPVLAEKTSLTGQLLETLPIPIIANAARAMGHVHVELDQDGIARSAFLKGGLGSPHWNHLAYEMVKIANPNNTIKSIGIKNPIKKSAKQTTSSLVWARNNKMLIPYAGAPGHFQTLPFFQVFNQQFPKGIFKNKIVLIGATASGLGDALPTPVSGETHSMPGVEINANIINNLAAGINISILPIESQMLISIVILLITIYLYSVLTPKLNLISIAFMVANSLILSLFLLQFFHIWFPPAPVLLALALSYPLWSWRRLENTIRYLDQELVLLTGEYEHVPNNSDIAPQASLRFLAQLLPIEGWGIYNSMGEVLITEGNYPTFDCYINTRTEQWLYANGNYWLTVGTSDNEKIFSLKWSDTTQTNKEQQALLNDFILKVKPPSSRGNKNRVDTVDNRIEQVQKATFRMRGLRQFIAGSLSQMANGVLIVDPLGNIAIANQRAADYLGYNHDSDIHGKSLLDVLENIIISHNDNWIQVYKQVLLNHQRTNIEAKNFKGKDFLIQFAPLDRQHRELGGLIVNMADISELKASERRRDEVLGFLSHDLRTPLVSLIALLEIAKTKKPNHEVVEILGRIGSYAENTITLAEEFLHLAHAESGENINFVDADLTSIALNAIEQMWVQSEAKNIELNYHFEIDEAWLLLDSGLIERVILNLLNNAVKYSPENSLVTLTLSADEDSYKCCIQDQGIGIPEDEIDDLFGRYYRVKASKQNIKGIGLGLAFVKVVMDKHQGDISVTSEVGEGSRFCFKLPKVLG